VSHELKTPLLPFRDSPRPCSKARWRTGARQEFVATIKANSERINSLVDDLMTISKIELGAIAAEKTDVAFGTWRKRSRPCSGTRRRRKASR